MDSIKNIQSERWFYGFLLLHVAIWTLAPAWFRYNLPLDAMEGTTWGEQFAWGYDKNPFMTAWLTQLAVLFGGPSGAATYLISQLSVALCFWSVWRLGKYMLPPLYALTAVMLLEGIQYYNLHAIDFSDNTLELATWALCILCFYQAVRTNKLRDWLLTGLFAGLAMMTKYYSIMLLIPMTLLLLINRDARAHFKNPSLYLGLLVFILVIIPHVIWLMSHDFITFDYAVSRVSVKTHAWDNHIRYALQFVLEQFEALLPTLLLVLTFFIGKNTGTSPVSVSRFDKQFLFFTAICPFLLTILLSAIMGINLRAAWGQPLFSLWGILFILWFKPVITLQKFYRFAILLFILAAITITVYCVNIIRGTKPSSANFPGKIIAATLTQLWHEKYQTPLKFVAGGRWLAGNISFYSKDHPQVYIDWNKQMSPWIDEAALRKNGAIFVWDLTAINRRKEVAIEDVTRQFTTMGPIEIMYFSWHNNKNLPPAEIKVAFLPPANNLPK